MAEREETFLDRIQWPAAVLLIVTVLGILTSVVAALVLVPEGTWEKLERLPWTTILAVGVPAIVAAITAIRGAFSGPAVAPKTARATTPPVGSRRTDGYALPNALLFVLAVAFGLAGCALLLPGCGASALRAHATATAIAGIAVESAEDIYLAHLDAAQSACSDEACVLAAREAHAPAQAAISLARVANGVYRDAIQIANEAEESPSLVSALVTAALRLAARWAEVVAIMAGLGVEVPALPLPGGGS